MTTMTKTGIGKKLQGAKIKQLQLESSNKLENSTTLPEGMPSPALRVRGTIRQGPNRIVFSSISDAKEDYDMQLRFAGL